MISRISHPMISTKDKESRLEVFFSFQCCVDLGDNRIHLTLLVYHIWTTAGSGVPMEGGFNKRQIKPHLLGPDLCPIWSRPR